VAGAEAEDFRTGAIGPLRLGTTQTLWVTEKKQTLSKEGAAVCGVGGGEGARGNSELSRVEVGGKSWLSKTARWVCR